MYAPLDEIQAVVDSVYHFNKVSQRVQFKMITPITDLAENRVFLTNIFHIFGNTIHYAPNTDGDWTQMKTKKWPIIFIPIIILLWALPYGYSFVFVYPETGHNILNMSLI